MPHQNKIALTGKIILLIVFVSLCSITFAQTTVKTIIGKIDDYNTKLPAEKLYLQFDKPFYAVGDTIWFKGYILNQGLSYSPLSGRIYIDLVNDSSVVVKRYIFAARIGITWGNIALDASVFHGGGYTLRAYTTWMRNFGEESFFYKSFYFADPLSDAWLVSADTKLSEGAKNGIETKLKFTSLNKQPADNQNFNIRLMNGKKTLLNNTMQTGDDGVLDVDFNLPDAGPAKNLTVIATDKTDNKKKSVIPIRFNRVQDIDLQFMPEGGQFVASMPNNLGFKAIGEDGRGVDITGVILDKNGNEMAVLASIHKGMGVTTLTPLPGETYTAKITLANGDTRTISLPQAKATGTVLRIKNVAGRDSISFGILVSDALAASGKVYHLVAEARGVVCYGATINLNDVSITSKIPKSLFPTGIVHFTLLNELDQPVNERLIFIDQNDGLKIDVKSAKTFTPRDSIPMTIKVTDSNGKPVSGIFSMAVTDDAQVKKDPDNNSNILSSILLSSDLKGYVEDPAYYFSRTDQSAKALDALLLTQGWIGYNWNKIIAGTEKVAYQPEPEFNIKGKVTNLLGKPIANSSVLLMGSGKYKMIRDTAVGNDGNFTFDKIPLMLDSTSFVLTAHTKKGRTINGGITVDELTPAPVVTLYSTPVSPWYVNADSTLLNYINTNNSYQVELDKISGYGRVLKTVNIRDRYSVKNSLNLNGNGQSDQTLTTADMEAAGKATLLDVIEKDVKGFHEGFIGRTHTESFLIKDKRVHFVIDGVDMDRFYQSTGPAGVPNEHYQYQKDNLEELSAEDILGIEVLYSSQYTSRYSAQNLTARQMLAQNPAGLTGSEIAFIEVTTRSGHGLFMKKTGAVYVYKPTPVSEPKEFYKPRYTAKTIHPNFNDLRSTIYWEQNIVTNKNGEATLSFYAADKPTTYTVILEGADLNGKIGYRTTQINIVKAGK